MGWKYQWASRIFSRDFIDQLKAEPSLVLARLLCFTPRNRAKIRAQQESYNSRLILGSGPHVVPGWTSVDLFPPTEGIRWDLRWKLPFVTGSVSEIHCEHFLEHLRYPDEATDFVRECARLLKGDGRLRVVVPDAEKYMRAYSKRQKSFWAATRTLGNPTVPFTTEMEIINQAFRMGGAHKFLFDLPTLTQLLNRAGFIGVVVSSEPSTTEMDLTDPWRTLESMYITATKSAVRMNVAPEKKKVSSPSRRTKKAA